MNRTRYTTIYTHSIAQDSLESIVKAIAEERTLYSFTIYSPSLMSERSKPRIMSSVDQDKDEILRFIKSYHFTTGRFPKVSHIKQYTTLKYPIVINAIVKELIQDKKVEVLKEGKVNEYEIRLLPTA